MERPPDAPGRGSGALMGRYRARAWIESEWAVIDTVTRRVVCGYRSQRAAAEMADGMNAARAKAAEKAGTDWRRLNAAERAAVLR